MAGETADSLGRPAQLASPRSCLGRRGLLCARQILGQPPHVLHQLGKWPSRRARPGHHDQLDVRRDQRPNLPIRLADPPPRSIALRGSAQLPAHREARPPGLRASPQRDEVRPLEPPTILEDRLEFCRPPEALASRQREYRRGCWHCAGYTVRRLRPFARRRLSTFRPPCVFIRERNPCVFFRRRTFGWNVLFMDKLSCGWKNQRSLRTALDQVKARKPLATVCTAMVRSPPASSTAPSGLPGARGSERCRK